MPQEHNAINFLNQGLQPQSRWDRIYDWTASTAKYIIIFTEVIVLIAFGVRLYLDGKINDLDQEIEAQVAILDARRTEDRNIRLLDSELKSLSALNSSSYSMALYYKQIQDLIPNNIEIKSFNVSIDNVSINGTTSSYENLLVLEKNIKSAPFVENVTFSTSQQGINSVRFTANFKIKLSN